MNILVSAVRRIRQWIILFVNPLLLKQARLKYSKSATLREKIDYDVFSRPHFAYGVYRAAQQASALGLSGISVVEFGCAGGNGLIALEKISHEISQDLDIDIDIYGFDIGEGLPRPADYRDLPYAWKSGQFKMDIKALKSRLSRAELVIGDAADTVIEFTGRENIKPVGFVSFDMDYYSSTKASFELFRSKHENTLPRVYCYFDDVVGPDNELHSEFAGELLAISEFNEENQFLKIAPIHGLHHKRLIPDVWNDVTYIMHSFHHPLYNTYIETGIDMSLSLPAK